MYCCTVIFCIVHVLLFYARVIFCLPLPVCMRVSVVADHKFPGPEFPMKNKKFRPSPPVRSIEVTCDDSDPCLEVKKDNSNRCKKG